MTFFFLFLTGVLNTNTNTAWAWGERGHHVICEVATKLVQTPGLVRALSHRGHQMGHVCNIPDISWRSLPSEQGETLAKNAHFINSEEAGIALSQVPTSLSAYLALDKVGQTSEEKANRLGTLWWRVNQFFERAVASGKTAKLQQKASYDDAVYSLMVDFGLMGHFVGDSTMPFHTTNDYNGQLSGHKGIHSFYESVCVDQMRAGIEGDIFDKAKALMFSGLPSAGVVDQLKALSIASNSERGQIETLDVLDAKGKRLPAAIACPKFDALILGDLARAAAALATFWDMAYVQAGSPDFGAYHSYRYPLDPPLVAVDYVSSASSK